MHLRCLESKKRSPRTILPLPSPQSQCPLPSIKPAAASTVSVCLLGCCTLVPVVSCCRVAAVAITQGGAIQLANNGTDGVQGLQTLTMANTAAAQPGATILQYAQTSDGQQILVPSNQVVVQGGSISSILSPARVCEVSDFHALAFAFHSRLWRRPGLPDPHSRHQRHHSWGGHGHFASTGGRRSHRRGHTQKGSPAYEKQVGVILRAVNGSARSNHRQERFSHVLSTSDREAARECRRKKKEYVKCLENRVAVLENQNKTLIEELKALKDLYCHKSE